MGLSNRRNQQPNNTMNQPKINTGVLFLNDKRTNPKAPTKKGTLIDSTGKEWAIAVWSQVSKNGLSYETIKLSEPWKKDGAEEQEAF